MARSSDLQTKTSEFHSFFCSLDEDGQKNILDILKALEFAQSVILQPKECNTPSKECHF